MPKVMFRPNPVPPPFVPPVPPESSNVVVLSKYPFEADEPVSVYFKNMEVPQATAYGFDYYDNIQQDWTTVWEFEGSLPNETNPYTAYFELDSSGIGGYCIQCFNEEVLITTVPLIVQTA